MPHLSLFVHNKQRVLVAPPPRRLVLGGIVRAVSMLRAAIPVKEIGDLLGHRSTQATAAYIKLATEDLRAVALEIPAEVVKL
jgi:integrase